MFDLDATFERSLPGVTGKGRIAAEGTTLSDATVGRDVRGLLKTFEEHPWLRAIVAKIAEDCAEITWRTYMPKDIHEGRVMGRKAFRSIERKSAMAFDQINKYVTDALATHKLEEFHHPATALLAQPNPLMDSHAFFTILIGHYDLVGEWFCVIERGPRGYPAALYPIPPHWVTSTPTLDMPFFRVQANGRTGKYWDVPVEDMLWGKFPSLFAPYGRGAGLAGSIKDELEGDEQAAKFLAGWFHNKAMPSLLIGVEGATEEQLKEAKRKFQREFSGFRNSWKSHWHTGDISIHQLTHSFKEMELTQLRDSYRDLIRQIFSVPPEIMGILENSNRSTIDAAEYLYARRVLVRRLEKFRRVLQMQLLPQYNIPVLLAYDSPVPEDREHQLLVAKEAKQAFTYNEWRDFANRPPLPGEKGEELYEPVEYKSKPGVNSTTDEEEDDEKDADAA